MSARYGRTSVAALSAGVAAGHEDRVESRQSANIASSDRSVCDRRAASFRSKSAGVHSQYSRSYLAQMALRRRFISSRGIGISGLTRRVLERDVLDGCCRQTARSRGCTGRTALRSRRRRCSSAGGSRADGRGWRTAARPRRRLRHRASRVPRPHESVRSSRPTPKSAPRASAPRIQMTGLPSRVPDTRR